MKLVVCPLDHVDAEVRRTRPNAAISLLAPGQPGPPFPHGMPRLSLAFHDIDEARADLTPPDTAGIRRLLAFAEHVSGGETILIHCWLGVSRSPAAAFVLACAFDPDRTESEIAASLRAAAPYASPNRRLVALADAELGREGRMSAAIARIGRGEDARCGRPFELHCRAGRTQ